MAAAAASKRIVTVFGATGAQGGAVARALLADGAFSVRAVTRNPASDKAAALAEAGAEVVKADMSSAEEVAAAVSGAYAVFLVTQFWEKFDPALELKQGKIVADAALAAGVEHLVYSSLEDTRPANKAGAFPRDEPWEPLSDPEGEAWIVPHLDGKGAIRDYMIAKGVPATFVQLAFYNENWLGVLKPQVQEDGSRVFACPMGDYPLAVVAVEDTGPVVLAVLKNREAHLGKTYPISGDIMPVADAMAILTEVTGTKFTYAAMSPDAFAGLGFPGADDMARMFNYFCAGPKFFNRDPAETRALYPGTQTLRAWAEANKDALLA